MSDERRVPALSRRGFLLGAASMAALAACSSDDGGSSARATTTTARPTGTIPRGADPFRLGVASGDPDPDSVVLWTRLAPDPLARDGHGGMPDETVGVRWEVATDRRFQEVVADGTEVADPRWGHSVHATAGGLDPATAYFYRFTVGDRTSAIGRTKTLPAADASPEHLRLGIVNCQHLEAGFYAAYRHLTDEDVDLIVHLGDYIYELSIVGPTGPERRSLPHRPPQTVEEYRLRYASYKLDPDLQAAHAHVPFALMWDDHEVSDNYMGDTLPNGAPADQVRHLRAAAYQAYWEHLPIRLDPPESADVTLYRDVTFGDLARLYLLDERQYADVPPCRGDFPGTYDVGTCAEVGDDRVRLGSDQEAWLGDTAREGGVTWNLLGSPVALAGIDAGRGDEPVYYLDLWDGYPVERQRVIDLLAELDNPVVLSGDYHQGMVLDVNETPFDTSSTLVAPEFMAPPISSALFSQPVGERTPQLRRQVDAHGYLVVDVTPDELTVDLRVLDDVRDPNTGVGTDSTWKVQAGDPRTRQV